MGICQIIYNKSGGRPGFLFVVYVRSLNALIDSGLSPTIQPHKRFLNLCDRDCVFPAPKIAALKTLQPVEDNVQ